MPRLTNLQVLLVGGPLVTGDWLVEPAAIRILQGVSQLELIGGEGPDGSRQLQLPLTRLRGPAGVGMLPRLRQFSVIRAKEFEPQGLEAMPGLTLLALLHTPIAHHACLRLLSVLPRLSFFQDEVYTGSLSHSLGFRTGRGWEGNNRQLTRLVMDGCSLGQHPADALARLAATHRLTSIIELVLPGRIAAPIHIFSSSCFRIRFLTLGRLLPPNPAFGLRSEQAQLALTIADYTAAASAQLSRWSSSAYSASQQQTQRT